MRQSAWDGDLRGEVHVGTAADGRLKRSWMIFCIGSPTDGLGNLATKSKGQPLAAVPLALMHQL